MAPIVLFFATTPHAERVLDPRALRKESEELSAYLAPLPKSELVLNRGVSEKAGGMLS